MRAVILVGGYGTRLRPLTFSCPKPLVPFCNKPIVVHQIEALVQVGVKEIILCVSYQPQVMMEFLRECEKEYGISIVCSKEDEPLGTAGPLALARKYLTKDNQPFFMFNSDVICSFPLKEMLEFHLNHGREGTILTTPVKDPSKYGVVVAEPNGRIKEFIEKPQVFVSDQINAGMYLLNPSVLSRIEPKPTSIEREVFPKMAAENELYRMELKGYWMDIGQPKDYLIGMELHLRHSNAKAHASEYKRVEFVGNNLVAPGAKIGMGTIIGPDVVIGANVVIGSGVRIQRSTLLNSARVGDHSWVRSSIVGWESSIGKWARVDDCVFGKDVAVGSEASLEDVVVCPHKGIKDSTRSKIIM